MTRHGRKFEPRAGACIILVWLGASAFAAGDDAASRGWSCSLCPLPDVGEGRLEMGPGWVSESDPRFGDYRGLPDAGGFLAIDGEWHDRASGGHYRDLSAKSLGTDARQVEFRGGRRGRYSMNLSYREIPKYRGSGTKTVFRADGRDALTLPADWVPAGQTAGMSALDTSLLDASLATKRKTLSAELAWRLAPRWTGTLGIEHQRKEGTRPFGAGLFLLNTSHFPAPVDFTTTRLDAGLAFSGQQGGWRLAYARSDFENRRTSIAWSNPFTPLPGTEWLRASLEPANDWEHVSATGAWAPAHWLRLSARASVGRMEQNEALLPASSNPGFADVQLPRARTNARIDASNLNLAGNLNANLSTRLSLSARWRRDQRDNRTPVDSWTPIITDFVPRDPRPNRPYSFTRDRSTLSFRYRASAFAQWRAGFSLEDHERTLQAVRTTRERTLWGEYAHRAGPWMDVRFRLEKNERDSENYLQPDDGGPVDHPLLRKFHLADRTEQRLLLALDISAIPGVSLGARYEEAQADFEHSPVGLRVSDMRVLSVDAGVRITEALALNAYASRDWFDSSQAGIESPAQTPWHATTIDRFTTVGVGLAATPRPGIEVRLDVVHSESRGDIHVVSDNDTAPFPALATEMFNARFQFGQRFEGPWGLKAWLEYEQYRSDDWARDGLGPGQVPAVLTLGNQSPDYGVVLVAVQASYFF